MTKKPNIIFIQNDHQAYYRHGWDGGVKPKRPHFDKFASEGVTFNNAYTSVPLCGPARRTMLTGIYPHEHGQHHNYTDPPYDHEVYLNTLHEGGYKNYYYGKWHAGPGTALDHNTEGFCYTDYGNPYITKEYKEYLERYNLPKAEHRIEKHFELESFKENKFFEKMKVGELYQSEDAWCGEHAIGITETPKETHESFFLATLACEQLEKLAAKDDDEPFSLRVDFWGPHQPYFPTKEFADLYDPSEIERYGSFDSTLEGKPEIYKRERNIPLGTDDIINIPNPLPWSDWQLILARCYAHISMLDAAGGMIVDKLKELGLDENTLIIWTTDHGDAVASHGGRFDKSSYMSEEVMRIPYAMRWPERIKPGQVREELISNVDTPITILDAAGLKFPHKVHGRSLLEIFDESASTWRNDLMSETYGHGYGEEIIGRMLRKGDYKYVYNDGQLDELYNIVEDPYEMNNLTLDENYADVLQDMKQSLLKWQKQTDDPEKLDL